MISVRNRGNTRHSSRVLTRLISDGGGSDVKSERNSETPVNEEMVVETRVDGARTD